MRKNKTRALTQKLLALSLDGDRQVCPERVRHVLQVLSDKPFRQLKPVLKAYYQLVRRELNRTEAVIEYSGKPKVAALRAAEVQLTELTGRKITVVPKRVPGLIAGLRIRLGDHVYEDSLATRLNALLHAVEA